MKCFLKNLYAILFFKKLRQIRNFCNNRVFKRQKNACDCMPFLEHRAHIILRQCMSKFDVLDI